MRLFPLALVAVLALPFASAQSRIGNVVLTPIPAPTRTLPQSARSEVPAGWQEVLGRVSAPAAVRLPAGSRVNVIVDDPTRTGAARQVLRVDFAASRLSAPYQIVFNASRLVKGRTYGLRATVTDRQGRVLYASTAYARLPQDARSVVNLSVGPVR
ncbi:YbaY family lipoprotein [Deinococcus petrolearius]|uniref:YbaY family lipoprotein n=1 Tax=Deinococcus petrolearius TaxID=1751295 RepID=A0ABW1DI54_9DEIO